MPDYKRPENEVELNQQLAETIGASVEQLMGQTGWTEANNILIDQTARGGQPAAAPAGGEERPAATPTDANGQPVAKGSEATKVTDPLATFDQFKDANGKYIGKYDTVEQFVRGIGHAMNMTKETLAANDDLNRRLADQTRQLDELRRQPAPTQGTVRTDAPVADASPAPARKSNPKLAEALASLAEGNLDAEGLVKLVDVISEHTALAAREAAREEQREREAVAQATASRWDKVDQFMTEKYPDSMKFTTEMGLFTKTNKQIGAVVSALIEKDLHEQAMEYAWTQFVAAHGLKSAPAPFKAAPATPENVEKEIKLDAADQVRREAVEEARKDAGILGAGAGNHGVHENQNVGPTQGELDEAAALMRNGQGAKWRSLVFKDILSHPLFN